MRKQFANKILVSSFVLCFTLATLTTGCGKIQHTLQAVLQKAPTVLAIVHTGIDLANIIDPSGVDPAFRGTVDSVYKEVSADITTLVSALQQYQNDIGSADPGTLVKAHELYRVIDAQLASFTAAFHFKSTRAQNEAALIVDSVDAFLSELGSLLPPSPATPAATTLVKTQAALVGVKVKIVSAHEFAKNFNKSSKENFPQLQVAVP